MPNKAKNYSKSKIYVIRNTQNDKIYVGSTTQALSKRMVMHRSCAKTLLHRPLYQAFNDIGIEHFYIELIEDYPCESIEQLLRKEGEWIRHHNSFENGYNGCIAGRNQKEYREENKDKIKEYREENKDKQTQYQKEWYDEHKEKVLQQNKEWKEKNKDKIKQQSKEYRENNRDKIRPKLREHYEKNKETYSQKVECDCGCVISYCSLSTHRKSKKHQEWLQSQPSTSS